MKSTHSILRLLFSMMAGLALFSSCTKDLLEQAPTSELGANAFWETEDDALSALMGAYNTVRPCFDRDYHFDGHGDYLKVYNTGVAPISITVNSPSNYGGGASAMYRALYGAVNHTNYVIENVKTKMLPKAKTDASIKTLETIVGEARLLRGLTYLRLISLWGDVQYFNHVITNNAEAQNLPRTPLEQVKDSILADFTYAYEKLPAKSGQIGRASKPAALAFRGKMQLYWASWNKNGWPELEGFQASPTKATAAYTAAAADFKSVINDYGLQLFRGGEPGQWGTMGNADVLPNYFYMFIPSTGNPNTDGEMIFVLTHGSTGSGQSEEYMRVWTGVSVGLSQNQVVPRFELANRYQSTITGDFAEPLIPMNPATPGARTALNSAINPESYRNRDYRMKGTLLWDYEMIQGIGTTELTSMVPFIYKTWGGYGYH